VFRLVVSLVPLDTVPKSGINIRPGRYPLAPILFILRIFLYGRFEGGFHFWPRLRPFASLALLASLYIFLGILVRRRWAGLPISFTFFFPIWFSDSASQLLLFVGARITSAQITSVTSIAGKSGIHILH